MATAAQSAAVIKVMSYHRSIVFARTSQIVSVSVSTRRLQILGSRSSRIVAKCNCCNGNCSFSQHTFTKSGPGKIIAASIWSDALPFGRLSYR